MKLAKELTAIYIRCYRNGRLPPILVDKVRDALVLAQSLLTTEQLERYTKWHKKQWPNLDW